MFSFRFVAFRLSLLATRLGHELYIAASLTISQAAAAAVAAE